MTTVPQLWKVIATLGSCLAITAACHAQRVSPQDVLRGELPEYFAPHVQKEYVEALVRRLDANDDARIILDVIEMQLRSYIDLGLADKLDPLIDATSRLSVATTDPMRSASIAEQVARARFYSGHDAAGLTASANALASQEAVLVNGAHPDPTRLFRHLIDHAQLVTSMMSVDVLVSTLKRAEKLLPTVRHPALAALDHDNLMVQVYVALGDHGRAQEILASMLERATRMGLATWEAEAQFSLAEIYIMQARYAEAKTASQRSLTVHQSLNNQVGVASTLQQLAYVSNASGAPEQAYEYAEKAMQAFDHLDDAFAKADSRRELAFAAALMGDARKAHSLIDEALALRPENTSPNWAYSIARLRTRIALADKDIVAARRAMQREDQLRDLRQMERGLRHTRATRALFEVGERELRVQLLERDNEIRRLDNQRNEAQIALQRWWIGGGFALFALSLCAASLLYFRSISLKRAAYTDSLTQVMSRAAILRRLQRTLDRARTTREPVSVIMMDIDEFKAVNDTYGHSAGDAVLKLAAGKISSMIAPDCRIGRLGGDEFMVVMPNTSRDSVQTEAERIMAALRELKVDHQDQMLRIAVSMGVASTDGQQDSDLNDLVHAADAALLEAKHGGRNRVVVTDPTELPTPRPTADAPV